MNLEENVLRVAFHFNQWKSRFFTEGKRFLMLFVVRKLYPLKNHLSEVNLVAISSLKQKIIVFSSISKIGSQNHVIFSKTGHISATRAQKVAHFL